MVNEQLLSYIKQQLSINVGKEVITARLKSEGWTDGDVNEAFSAISPSSAPAPVAPPISPAVPLVASNITEVQTVSPQIAHKKSKKIIPIIVVLILLLLAGGSAAYAYYTGMFVTLPGLLSGYTTRAQALKSFKIDADISVDFSQLKSITDQLNSITFLPKDATKLDTSLLASYDVSDRDHMKTSLVVSLALGSLSAGAEMRILQGTSYAKLTKIPSIGILPLSMLDAYKDKWFSTTDQSLFSKNLVNKFTQEETAYIEKMFQDANITKTITRLAPETIAGEPSYHFSFDFDKQALINYMKSYEDYLVSIKKNDSNLPVFDAESFGKTLDKVKDFKGEIWIGRSDKLVHKLSVDFGIQPDLAKNEQAKVNVQAILSDYNQPVSIVAPAESTPFASLMEASINDAQRKGNEAAIKATLSGVRAQAELFWDSNKGSYSGFCSSKELKDAKTQIEKYNGTGFVCRDVVKKYVASIQLSQESGYWCVDSNGNSKSTTTSPTSLECPIK